MVLILALFNANFFLSSGDTGYDDDFIAFSS